jgi:hypothetical protein
VCNLTTVHCGATLFPALPTITGYCVRVGVKLGSRVRGLRLAASFANQLWQALEGPHNRGGEVPPQESSTSPCVELPLPFTTADIHAELTHM